MLRHYRIRARPAIRGIPACRSRRQHPLRPTRARPQQSHVRQYSNYSPNQPPPTYFYTPRSRWSRVKDMAIGSALTITAYVAWRYYHYRRFVREVNELRQRSEEHRQMMEEFACLLDQAREAGDEIRMRELVFERQRRIADDLAYEAGPLPGFPAGHELYAKEKVPVEDTLMFIEKMDEDGTSGGPSQSQWYGRDEDQNQPLDSESEGTSVMIAVNADSVSMGYDPERDSLGDIVAVDPQETKVQELLWRFENQVKAWRKEDRKDMHDDFQVILILRDNTIFCFLYTDGVFRSLGARFTLD